jgi:ribonuclease HI
MWDWWTTRNKKNAEGKERSIEDICHIIQRHLLDFQAQPDQITNFVSDLHQEGPKLSWTKPPENHVKVNFDAAFVATLGLGAWGFIARSDTGNFVGAAAGKLRHLRDALQAEAEAGVAAVEGAVALGLNQVIFESDSKNLVSALIDKTQDLSAVGVLLKEIRSICLSSFESFHFQFVPRVYNGAAHSLAQYGLRAESECTGWEGDAPDFVSVIVASDNAVHAG